MIRSILLISIIVCAILLPGIIDDIANNDDIVQLAAVGPDSDVSTVAEAAEKMDDVVEAAESIALPTNLPKTLNCTKVAGELESFRKKGLNILKLDMPYGTGVYSFGRKSIIEEAFNEASIKRQESFVYGLSEAYTKAQACRVQGYPDAFTWERELGMIMSRLAGDEILLGDSDLLLVNGIEAGDAQSVQVMAQKLDKISRRLIENSQFLERYLGNEAVAPLYAMNVLDNIDGKPENPGEALEIARDVQGALDQIETIAVNEYTAPRLNDAILDEIQRYEPCLQWTIQSYQNLADRGNPLAAARAESLKYMLAGPRTEPAQDPEEIADAFDGFIEGEVLDNEDVIE